LAKILKNSDLNRGTKVFIQKFSALRQKLFIKYDEFTLSKIKFNRLMVQTIESFHE
jgi:hypothetical protein